MVSKKKKGGGGGGKKKKKGGGDLRGYATTNVSANTKNKIQLSSNTNFQELKELATESSTMEQTKNDTSSKIFVTDNKRLVTKLTKLYTTLQDYQFKKDQIESILVQTCLSSSASDNDEFISLESALDWACWNLPSEELPPLFTDISTRQNEEKDTQLTVLVSSSNPQPNLPDLSKSLLETKINDQKEEKSIIENSSKLYVKEKKESSKKMDDTTKQWILSQYEQEEEEEEEESKHSKVVAEMKDSSKNEQDEINSNSAVVKLQLQLEKVQEQVSEQESLLGNEASLYMMSKVEVKELKKVHQSKKKLLKSLENKLQKEKQKIQKEQSENDIDSKKEEDEEDYTGGFNLFDSPDDDDEDEHHEEKHTPTVNVDNQPPKQNDETNKKSSGRLDGINCTSVKESIPKNWTGKTPKQILQDYCKQQKYHLPTFLKIPPRNGCAIRIQSNQNKIILKVEEEGPFVSNLEAQYFVSTIALYEISRKTNSNNYYHILPPIFRELWKTWRDQDEDQQTQMQQIQQQELNEVIANILKSIQLQLNEKESQTKEPQQKSNMSNEKQQYVNDDAVSWEDNLEDSNVLLHKDNDTAKNKMRRKALRTEFIQKQKMEDNVIKQVRCNLPMYNYRAELLNVIRQNSVTIICAETGAGKTTQCPQYILEDAILEEEEVSIICTQPRRISAISVAERVAEEMVSEKYVGYQIRMESKRTSHTKLLNVTTGVILRRLQDDPTLHGITHVIVDEVHERQWQIDFLLIALRRILLTTRPDLKVILMSATLDAKLFCNFFQGAPLIQVPGRTFPVTEYYLEDLLDATDHIIEADSKYAIRFHKEESTTSLWVTGRGGEKRKQTVSLDEWDDDLDDNYYHDYKPSTQRSMARVDEKIINYDLIEDVLSLLLTDSSKHNNQTIIPPNEFPKNGGSVLIFLPGMGEIRTLAERLRYSRTFGNENVFLIIPMHSTISSDDQKKAFKIPKKNCRKIILATNIAETSVTIPDIVCVIDCGLMREIRQDKHSGISTLVTDFCSKANCKQRAGRAGRVQSGICCKLYSSRTAEETMRGQSVPELQRIPLEEVCLNILAGKLSNNCMDFLCQAPQAPSEEAVSKALLLLKEVGAIEDSIEKVEKHNLLNNAAFECLTPLGHHLAKLPVHVRVGKMLLFGVLFKCLDRVLTIAASLSTKSPFSNKSFDQSSQQADSVHKLFAHPTSDFLTLCNVWEQYHLKRQESTSVARKFCQRNFLNYTALIEIGDMRIQFLQLLAQIGFIEKIKGKWYDFDVKGSIYNIHGRNDDVSSAVICAGLYPNIARIEKPFNGGIPTLWQRNDQLFFHSSSVNHNKVNFENEWIVFHEKFATRKVFVTVTSTLHPFSLLIFGKSIRVLHTERKAIIDDWIELNVAAQISVMFRELRKKVDIVLQEMVNNVGKEKNPNYDKILQGIIDLLSS